MAKNTAQQLLEQTKRIKADAEVLRTLWQESFPPNLPPPADWELKNAVRRLALADLTEGIQSYLVLLSDKKTNPTPKNALNYICATAWKIKEQENPDQNFHPTARRQRNAERDPNSYYWNGEAFGAATPKERQKIIGEAIAKQKKEKGGA